LFRPKSLRQVLGANRALPTPVSLARKNPFLAANWRCYDQQSELLRQAEHLVLSRPFDRCIAQTLDANSAWQPTFDLQTQRWRGDADRGAPRTALRTLPACTSLSRRCRAGRSVLPPEKPPSSYLALRRVQPAWAWLRMYACEASYWASSELKSCSSPWSVETRV
jgi:hypothetical protein